MKDNRAACKLMAGSEGQGASRPEFRDGRVERKLETSQLPVRGKMGAEP